MIHPGRFASGTIIRGDAIGRLARAACLLALLSAPAGADELEDLAALWSIADEPYQPVTRQLDTPPFVHRKVLSIDAQSLDDGWVDNHQCHRNFPLFPALQIAFRDGQVRNMRIIEKSAVEQAWATESTIQMKRTRPETRLCFLSENHTVEYDLWNDEYRMTVGPYYLKLFDGYFPLDVDLTVEYPHESLRFIGLEPDPVEGASVELGKGRIHFNALFEGKLKLVFRFKRA